MGPLGSMRGVVVGMDLGGTNLKCISLDREGNIHESFMVDYSSSELSAEGVIDEVISSLRRMEGMLKGQDVSIRAVGIAVAGFLFIEEGIVHYSPNIRCLDGFNILNALKSRVGYPVFLENDVNAATMGEWWKGAADGLKDICCIMLGTGVGGGIIQGGRIVHGGLGTAGEIGHMVVEPEGLPCNCGGRGCLEVYASANGLKKNLKWLMEKGETTEVVSTLKEIDNLSAEDIFNASLDGDPLCKKLLSRMGYYLGVGMVNLVHILNPQVIVIGGGLSRSWGQFMPTAKEIVEERAVFNIGRMVSIRKAKNEEYAASLGAGYTAWVGLKGE